MLPVTDNRPARRALGARRRTAWTKAVALGLAGALALLSADGAAVEEERMKVRGVVADPRTRTPVLVLEDYETGRTVLPLWIGTSEATAILLALKRVQVNRPMTHDLMQNLLNNLHARVIRVVITELRQNTFHANIFLRAGGELFQMDSRPSDAIALALRTDAPIFASSDVLKRAGQIQPNGDALVSELKAYGLTLQEITAELAPHFAGAAAGSILITDVQEGGQGARDGLKRGDIILRINDFPVRGLDNFLRLVQSANSSPEEIRISVNRGNSRLQLVLTHQR